MTDDEDLKSPEFQELTIRPEHLEQFRRLDKFLASQFSSLSRSQIKTLFEAKKIKANGISLSLNKMPVANTNLTIEIPSAEDQTPLAEDIPLEVMFQDEHIAIINKKAGMVVHPAPGNKNGTLVNAILHHCDLKLPVGDEKRPGIVHRLDKGTSGVIVIAKTQEAYEKLVQTFSKHDLTRSYICIAVTKKEFPPRGILESVIGRHLSNRLRMSTETNQGKPAKTFYKTLSSHGPLHYIECTLETGRTHQIRVHLTELLEAPLLCDSLYTNAGQHLVRFPFLNNYPYPYLHAKILAFSHPITGEELSYEAPIPEAFQLALDNIRENL